MGIHLISDPEDPRVAGFVGLRKDDRKQASAGTFVVEGRRCVRRLIDSSVDVIALLVQHGRQDEAAGWVDDRTPIYAMHREQLQAVAGYPFHRGFLALANRPRPLSLRHWLSQSPPFRVAIASLGISERENLGSVIRTATALGLGPVLYCTRSADPYSRMAIRASMATVLKQSLITLDDPPADLQWARGHGVRLVAATTHADPRTHRKPTPLLEYQADRRPTILVVGHESDGIPAEVEAIADDRVCIPMAGGVDSLNAAVAAAILMHGMSATEPE
ncbi:MAG: RNA methyltransferase [Planctomycetota bacterium]